MVDVDIHIGNLELIKRGSDKMSQLGSKMVSYKNKLFVSSHGTNIFSGSIYILEENIYIYPNSNMNQCWGFHMVSNGDILAISAPCDKAHTGYVQLYPSRQILMRGEYIGDNCGFHVAWFNHKWWVSCHNKIWNSNIGFIRYNIDTFPLFFISNTFITLQYQVKSIVNKTLYYNIVQGYYYDSLLLPPNIIVYESLFNSSLILYGCRQEEVYITLFNSNVSNYCSNTKNRYYGSSLYSIQQFQIIGNNQSVIIFNNDTKYNFTIQIPSFQNTTFSYYYISPFLYIGSYSSFNFTGAIYRINITIPYTNPTLSPTLSPILSPTLLPIKILTDETNNNNTSIELIAYWIIALIVFGFYLLSIIVIMFYICNYLKNNIAPLFMKKKKDKQLPDLNPRQSLEPESEYQYIYRIPVIPYQYYTEAIMEDNHTQFVKNIKYVKDKYIKEFKKDIERNDIIIPHLPGAYHVY
jgi:hypothetical protein